MFSCLKIYPQLSCYQCLRCLIAFHNGLFLLVPVLTMYDLKRTLQSQKLYHMFMCFCVFSMFIHLLLSFLRYLTLFVGQEEEHLAFNKLSVGILVMI